MCAMHEIGSCASLCSACDRTSYTKGRLLWWRLGDTPAANKWRCWNCQMTCEISGESLHSGIAYCMITYWLILPATAKRTSWMQHTHTDVTQIWASNPRHWYEEYSIPCWGTGSKPVIVFVLVAVFNGSWKLLERCNYFVISITWIRICAGSWSLPARLEVIWTKSCSNLHKFTWESLKSVYQSNMGVTAHTVEFKEMCRTIVSSLHIDTQQPVCLLHYTFILTNTYWMP